MRTEDEVQIVFATDELENAYCRLEALQSKWEGVYFSLSDKDQQSEDGIKLEANLSALDDVLGDLGCVFLYLEGLENGKYFASTLDTVRMLGPLEPTHDEPITGHYVKQEKVRKSIGLFPDVGEQFFFGFLAGLCAVSTNIREPMNKFIERS